MATRIICNDTNLETPSTAHSTISTGHFKPPSSGLNNSRCYRRRLLKRLKEKFQGPTSEEDPYSTSTRPTVIRVGTVSSCASSTVRSRASTAGGGGGGGSWRFVDELFRGGRNGPGALSVASSTPTCPSTISSTKSGRSNKTIIYDDRWLEVNKPNFCTVVAVADGNEGQGVGECGSSIVTVVGVEDPAEIDSYHRITVEPSSSAFDETADPSGAGAKAVTDQEPDTSGLGPVEGAYPCQGPSPVAAASSMGPFQGGPEYGQALERNAEMPFDICAGPPLGSPGGHHILMPEDLPRMYPAGATWSGAMGVPIRFEEQLEDETKGCCGNGRESQSTFVRWFVGVISVIGVSCVIIGIVLGALIVSGSTRLTLCLLMIGVGIVLVTVSGIAWRLTTFDSSDGCAPDCLLSACCLSLCGLPTASERRRRRRAGTVLPGHFHSSVAYARVRSLHRGRGGGGHFSPPPPPPPPLGIGACIPPEFIWRPPPPSYHASMQEERMQNLFGFYRANEDVHNSIGSPPPTYRSHTDDSNRRQSVTQLVQVCAGASETRPGTSEGITTDQADQPLDLQPTTTAAAATGSTDCVLAPEPVQQDESASLVMNEQLQHASAGSDRNIRMAPRPRPRAPIHSHPWPPPPAMAGPFRPAGHFHPAAGFRMAVPMYPGPAVPVVQSARRQAASAAVHPGLRGVPDGIQSMGSEHNRMPSNSSSGRDSDQA